jgi:hypothetical protein
MRTERPLYLPSPCQRLPPYLTQGVIKVLNSNGLQCKRLGATKSFLKHFGSSHPSVTKIVEDGVARERFERKFSMKEPPGCFLSFAQFDTSDPHYYSQIHSK